MPGKGGAKNPQKTVLGLSNARRLKMAAAAEHRTVKGFLLALAEERIQELERKGILPKGK